MHNLCIASICNLETVDVSSMLPAVLLLVQCDAAHDGVCVGGILRQHV